MNIALRNVAQFLAVYFFLWNLTFTVCRKGHFQSPSTLIRKVLKRRFFFPPFAKKYASTRSAFESFSPIHTKTMEIRLKYDSILHRACVMPVVNDAWSCMTSCFRPSSRKRQAGRVSKNLRSAGCFWKDAFSVTVFTGYVWTVGQTGVKIWGRRSTFHRSKANRKLLSNYHWRWAVCSEIRCHSSLCILDSSSL